MIEALQAEIKPHRLLDELIADPRLERAGGDSVETVRAAREQAEKYARRTNMVRPRRKKAQP